MILYRICLTKEEVSELQNIVNKGSHSTQTYRAALILLNVDEGEYSKVKLSMEQIAEVLQISPRTVNRVKKKMVKGGLSAALERDKGSRIYEKKIDGEVEARIIAISCSESPAGYAKWTLRLIADKMVELQYVDSISHVSVGNVLKKTNLNRGK